MTWTHIPKEFWQGQLLGYTIVYKLLEEGEVEKLNQPWLMFNSTYLNNFTVLNGLNVYSKYSLKVAGYNKVGTGPFSTEVTFCKFLKIIYVAKIVKCNFSSNSLILKFEKCLKIIK